ncbi:putative GPI anchored cell wall protein [Aspergillus saccharolyticus JOP 1030-1]|uniref:GPI anchored cell wall protein n=1 Tax=Aspergillus saccharolyticus JOP 1030-1 TaxID=1450539 RepID=A0A318ZCL2_9EURO|nr:hypothetical protein BP01DRAFT_341400 [Aspergillus saccharolyticus JOP 1030-1]PYH45196.1 hypothetical protein BP01DRAFT_341400 [Aspergillus saccharolyticus JOP 1030-1]
MLLFQFAFCISLLAFNNLVTSAPTRACLLFAVGSQPNPDDLQAICITNGQRIKDTIADICGDDTKVAMQQFSDTCASAGYKVVNDTFTISGVSSSTAVPNPTQISSVLATPTGSFSIISSSSSSPLPSSNSSSTPSSYPSQVISAGTSGRHVPAAAFAAVVFGVAAAL